MLAQRMARAVLVLAALGAACESSAEEHILSRFAPAPPDAFTVSGRVRRGLELVPNAVVKVDASAVKLGVLTDVTNQNGLYKLSNAPFRYDLNVVTGRELTTFRGVAQRYLEPLLAGAAPPSGHTAHVVVTVDPAPPPTHEIVLSVSGSTDVVGVSGDLAGGLDVSFRPFSMTKRLDPRKKADDPSNGVDDPACTDGVKVHAVEIVKGTSLAAPIAYGRSCIVSLTSGALVTVPVRLSPIAAEPIAFTVQGEVPKGMTADPVDVVIDFGLRYLLLPVARIPLGGTLRLVRIPDVRYALRVRAHGGRALSDSGHFFFEPSDEVITPVLPEPLAARGPIDDGGQLSFEIEEGSGVRELTLVPQAEGAPSVRVVSTGATIVVPDPTTVGLPPLRGTYAWSVRRWPKLPFTDSMGGSEAREATPFAEGPSFAFTR